MAGSEIRLEDLLSKFQSGGCSEEEIKLLQIWLDAIEAESNINDIPEEEIERIKANMLISILQHEKSSKFKFFNFNFIQKIAASVIFFALISAAIFFTIKKYHSESAWIIVSTGDGQTKKIILADGSKVWLYSRTLLKYKKSFRKNRNLELQQGKAYFEVAHDATKPFNVKSGNINTTVLGTSFNIESFSNSSSVKVSVITGKVRVANEKQQFQILIPSQRITVQKNNNVYKVDSISIDKIKAWVEGEIIFENATVQDVLKSLNEYYNVDFVPHLNTLQGRFNLKIENSNTLSEALDIIQTISYQPKIKFEEKNQTIHVYEIRKNKILK